MSVHEKQGRYIPGRAGINGFVPKGLEEGSRGHRRTWVAMTTQCPFMEHSSVKHLSGASIMMGLFACKSAGVQWRQLHSNCHQLTDPCPM